MDCFDDEVLRPYVRGEFAPEEAAECRRHLEGCAACRERAARVQEEHCRAAVAELSRTGDMATGAPAAALERPRQLERGSSIGRFIVLDVLGQGGMGEVYAAFDPQLNRKVALKLLLPARGPADGETPEDSAKERLLREAQAMAQLSHPNVLPVFDVGEHAGRVFIAMEHVAGSTLRAWMKADKHRPWKEAVKPFLEAGRGLAAAHKAGLIHRDFKPDNVMLSQDGRVYVMDFGLARAEGAAELSSGSGASVDSLSLPSGGTATLATGLLNTRLTLQRGVVGTPGYMPPEQIRNEELDARADVFAFCASLYVSLYGQRPFVGGDARSVLQATLSGRIAPPPRGTKVPAWLHRVVLEGLSPDRDRRFSSMEALLVALQDDPSVRTRRLAAAAGVLLVLGAGAGAYRYTQARKAAECRTEGEALAAVWSAARQAEVEKAFLATGKSFAPDAWRRVKAALDGYTSRLGAQAEAACVATRVRREAPPSSLALQRSCLTQRQVDARALVDVFAQADAQVVEKSAAAVQELPPLDPCADVTWLARQRPAPTGAQAAAKMAELRAQLARAKALQASSKYAEALSLAAPIVEAARALPHAPLEAEALLLLGSAESSFGKNADAEAHLKAAIHTATTAGHDTVVAQAAAVLAKALRVSADRRQEALFLTDLGMAVVQRAPAGNERVLAQLYSAVGEIHLHNANFADAERAQRQALELATRAYGPDVGAVAAIEVQLGQALTWMGRYPEAQQHLTHALATIERAEGPEHPKMGSPLGIMATFYGMQGRNEEAIPYLQRAIAIMERTSADNRNTGFAYHNLGLVLTALGRYPEAVRYFEKALHHKEQLPNPSPNSVVSTLTELAKVHAQQRRFPEAHAYAKRALDLAEAKLGETSEWRYVTWLALASVLTEEGRFAEAVPWVQRVLAREKALTVDTMGVMSMARFQLAQVRWALKAPRAEVLALLQSAREANARANNTQEVRRVEDWAKAKRLDLAPLPLAKTAP